MRFYQKGASLLDMMPWLLVGAFVVIFLIRVGPVYVDDFTLNRVISAMEGSAQLRDTNERKIREGIERRLGLENIDAVDPRDMSIEVGETQAFIEFDYEVRTPFLGNVDVVIGFEHYHELRIQ